MSIVTLSDNIESNLNKKDLQTFAATLGIHDMAERDAEDYLTLLRSLEAVLQTVDNASDYVPPDLLPCETKQSRDFWKPVSGENFMNSWVNCCNLEAKEPGSGILSGRTVAIKDNIAIGGLPTTFGAPLSLFDGLDKYPVSTIDAVVVSRILKAGGSIKGTSTCESFCASPLSYTAATGPVHNPLLHGFTAGGSSSGSAALVAAHRIGGNSIVPAFGPIVDVAIGTDQAGSVRIPASYNGIYGLKPTFGLIPYTGVGSMSPMIDHVGPLAADLEGIAALLEVMAGYDGYDPRMTPESPQRKEVKPYLELLQQTRQRTRSTEKPGHKLRVGLLKESFEVLGVTDDVRNVVSNAAKQCFEAVGASVENISIPMHHQGPAIWTAATRPSMSKHLLQGKPCGHLSYVPPHIQNMWPPTQEKYEVLTDNNPAVVNIMLSERLAGSSKPGLEAKAHRMVYALRAAYDSAFEHVDVLVTPCAPNVAMANPKCLDSDGNRAGILQRLGVSVGVTNNTCPFNVTGHPGLNVPCGHSTAIGHPDVALPIGMQLIGKRWADEKLLEAAALFQQGLELTSTR